MPTTGGIYLSSETTPARNLLIHHNTVARLNGANSNANGGIYSRSRGVGSNVIIRDNLIDISSGPYGRGVDFGEVPTLAQQLDYNGYYKAGSSPRFGFNGIEYPAMSHWRSATGHDAHSQVFTTSPFVNRSAADFRVPAGHPARTASSTGGEIGAFAATRTIGVDLSGLPPAPTGLRIQPQP